MKLQILVPQYKEPFEVIKPLLDSLQIQQNIDMDELGVIICKDGEPDINPYTVEKVQNGYKINDVTYPFKIEYYICEHQGVSATRNACLDHSDADYVMFCDIDDMFMNACGLYVIFREINGDGFDTLMSAFVEETRLPEIDPQTKKPIIDYLHGRPKMDKNTPVYITRPQDSTFVHGKVHRRKFLINNNIRWNPELTIHEDSYFNCLCQRLAGPENTKYCPTPFYLWKWRDDSVCRHDPDYILKTYNNMLDSNTALVKELRDRNKKDDARFFICSMIYDAYFTMNKDEWINQDHRDYREAVERRFREYYEEFENEFLAIDDDVKRQIIMGIKNRMFGEGLMMESITFNDWIKEIKEKYKP